jgi:poly-gamma-glutamate capsule biosynthesis protein CapA/YwtB (metallophosphatase superfamily)
MTATLLFGGDIAPLRADPRNMFGDLAPLIREADLAVGNLEFALSDRGSPVRGKIYPHKGPASALAGLTEAGFDAVNLANNHMLDYGEAPLLDTLDALDLAGIARFGAGRDLAEAQAPVVVERGGLKIGLLGFTTTLPTGFAATDDQPGVNPFRVTTSYRPFRNLEEYPGSEAIVETAPNADDLAKLVAEVKALKARTDLVLVYGHWGTSMTERVHDVQRVIAHAAIDAGAAALFGGHQHVISGVEFYRGRPIIHGLGNLVFDFVAPFFTAATRRTIVFSARMTKDGLEDCRLIPCATGVNGPVARLKPREGEGAAIAETIRQLSEPLGTAVDVGSEEIEVKAV